MRKCVLISCEVDHKLQLQSLWLISKYSQGTSDARFFFQEHIHSSLIFKNAISKGDRTNDVTARVPKIKHKSRLPCFCDVAEAFIPHQISLCFFPFPTPCSRLEQCDYSAQWSKIRSAMCPFEAKACKRSRERSSTTGKTPSVTHRQL